MRSFWRFLGSFFSLMFSIFVEALLLIHMKDRLPSFFHIPRFAPPGGIQSAAYMSSRFVVSPCFAHGNWCRNSVTLNRWQGFTRVYVQSGEVLFSRLSKPGPPPENFHTSVLLFSCQGQMSAQSKLRRCCEKHLPYAEKLPVVWGQYLWFRGCGHLGLKGKSVPSHSCRRKMKSKNSIHTGFSTMSRRGGTRHSRHDLSII